MDQTGTAQGAAATVVWSTWPQAAGLVLRGRTARTAAPAALVVGTALSAVNQGALVLSGHAGAVTWLRVAVNYAVPFLVASIGYLSARRSPSPVERAVSGSGQQGTPAVDE